MGKHRKMKAGKKKGSSALYLSFQSGDSFVTFQASSARALEEKKPSQDESPTSLTPSPLAFTRSLLKTNNICLDLKRQHVLNRNGM